MRANTLNKFCEKFRAYIDRPTVLGVKDFNGNDTVRDIPIFATPAILEAL